MKLELPHPATVEIGADLPRRNRERPLRGLDLGDAHYLTLGAGYGAPDDEAVGGSIIHAKPDGSWCYGGISFDCDWNRDHAERTVWTVESWNPLTLSPSFLCHCGDHGFIREGRWVRA